MGVTRRCYVWDSAKELRSERHQHVITVDNIIS